MKKDFGLFEGKPVTLYEIENESMIVRVTDYGASLVSVILKDGHHTDVVLGFDDVSGYVERGRYLGAIVGRVCNRIEKGQFTIDGTQYQCPVNNNGNSLHGGLIGLDARLWTAEEKDNMLVFSCTSNAGEDGYPGNCDITVSYVIAGNELRIEYEAICDQTCPMSLTNHVYWNLDGHDSGSILNQSAFIDANAIGLLNCDGLTINESTNAAGTPFDFLNLKQIGQDITKDSLQLSYAGGYDHHFMFNQIGYKKQAEFQGKSCRMEVFTDMPGMHFYTANFLSGVAGKANAVYEKQSGFCTETQYYPNAVNYPNQLQGIVKPDKPYRSATAFRFYY